MWIGLSIVFAIALAAVLIFFVRRQGALEGQIERLQHDKAKLERHVATADQARAERQTLFNSMAEGVALLDAQGRLQLINQSLEKLLEIKVDVRGCTLLEAFHRPELEHLMERLAAERGGMVSIEVEVPTQPPRSFEVNAATVLDRDGRAQGAILIFHDLTRIRQLENTRREFVANVSHELRTPLSLIKGYVETLLDGAKDDPEVTSKFLRTIERHSNRLTNLIEDLLTISRLESGQITLQLNDVALRPFVDHLLGDLHKRAGERGIAVINEVPTDLEGRADPDRLEQVLVNLLDNAIKYGRPQGRVLVRARPVNGHVELCVADDGPGIPSEALDRIFERFYRVDRARSRETGGTGLGLAIVKHIVQSHGGKVWVESGPGEGARFYFTLPRPARSTEQTGQEASPT